MFSSNYWCYYHLIINVNITIQGVIISHPRYVIVAFHSTLNSLPSVLTISYPHMSQYHLPTIDDLTLLMRFFHYNSLKLLHKNHTLFSLIPPFSNKTFVYLWEVMSHQLHMLPPHHQSHLHLACLFTSHLCHLPHILPQIPLSGIMFLLIQITMILKCIPYIT